MLTDVIVEDYCITPFFILPLISIYRLELNHLKMEPPFNNKNDNNNDNDICSIGIKI